MSRRPCVSVEEVRQDDCSFLCCSFQVKYSSQPFFSASLVVIVSQHCSRFARNHVGDTHVQCRHSADDELDHQHLLPNFIKIIPDRTSSTTTIEDSGISRAHGQSWQIWYHGFREGHECWRRVTRLDTAGEFFKTLNTCPADAGDAVLLRYFSWHVGVAALLRQQCEDFQTFHWRPAVTSQSSTLAQPLKSLLLRLEPSRKYFCVFFCGSETLSCVPSLDTLRANELARGPGVKTPGRRRTRQNASRNQQLARTETRARQPARVSRQNMFGRAPVLHGETPS